MRDKRLDDMEEYILSQKDSSLDELCKNIKFPKIQYEETLKNYY